MPESHAEIWPGASDLLWWACAEPERPPDPYIMWKQGCRACLVKAESTVDGGGPGVDVLARFMGLDDGGETT
jgi:hypothetical protein